MYLLRYTIILFLPAALTVAHPNMTTYSKDTFFKLKALGIYQLLFAATGFALTVAILVRTGFQHMQITAVFALVLVLYFYGILCGILCWQKRKQALPYSLVNQYLQLIGFSIVGYGFRYIAGLALYLGIDMTNDFFVSLKLEVLSTWKIQLEDDSDVILINFNIIAMLAIIIINRLRKVIAEEEEEMELLEIGNKV